jgi:hypothetical protein
MWRLCHRRRCNGFEEITMKRFCAVLMCATVMMASTVGTALARQPAPGQNDHGRVAEHMRFDDHDRQVTRTWYDSHQRALPVGFRATDRFSPEVELQFQEGYVIDRPMRGEVHSVPSALLRVLAPAPRTYRYVVIQGHVALIDSDYRVHDVIHVGHDR